MEYNYTDPYLLELIKEAIEDEAQGVKEYKQMAELAQSEEKQMLEKIALDEEKHYNMLNEIYKKLNNSTVTPIVTEGVRVVKTERNKKAMVKAKLDKMELYRVLYFNLKQPRYKNYVFEIMSDEQKHAIMLGMNISE